MLKIFVLDDDRPFLDVHIETMHVTGSIMLPQGEPGQNALKANSMDGAIADFKKKFKDKTKNDWDKRDNFQPVPGKYTLIELGDDQDEAATAATAAKVEYFILTFLLAMETQTIVRKGTNLHHYFLNIMLQALPPPPHTHNTLFAPPSL